MTALLLLLGCPGPIEPSTEACTTCDGACVEETVPSIGAEHVEGQVDYPDYPPSSGDHDACWAEWGVHAEAVPAENWVHNLEHGGVVLLHGTGADGTTAGAADVEAAAAWVATLPEGRALMTPAEEPMAQPWAVVAWQYRLQLGCWDQDAVAAFFEAHAGNAPEDTTAAPGDCAMDTAG